MNKDDNYRRVYAEGADQYDRLIQAEDADGCLGQRLVALVAPKGKRVLDVGTGTGRLLRLFAKEGAEVVGFDRAPAMLSVAQAHIERERLRARVGVADASHLPTPSGWADVTSAGWVFGHLTSWLPDDWQEQIGVCLEEMQRAARPGACAIVLETLGTATPEARPPSASLAAYYDWLESAWGFTREVVRTDYVFSSVDEAVEITGAFFGDELAGRVRENRWARVPESTALFTRIWG